MRLSYDGPYTIQRLAGVSDKQLPASAVLIALSIRGTLPHLDVLLSNIKFQVAPGLDGITGVLVRRQNFKRMGLLADESPDSPLLPFKIFSKKAVLQEIARKGKDSDWTDHRSIIKASQARCREV